MAIDNLNNEDMSLTSPSLPQRSEEHGFDLLNNGSSYLNGVAGHCQHNDMPISLPVVSMSPPSWNGTGISQCHSRETVPAGGNLITDSSLINSSKNFQTCHHYLPEEDHKSLLCRLGSDFPYPFPYPKGYREQPYQCNYHDYLTIPDAMMNSSFNLNNSEKLDGDRKVALDNNGSAGGPQVLKPSAKVTNGITSQPSLNLNLGMPSFSPNLGAVSLNCPGILERYMTFGFESDSEPKFNTNISGINVTGNSKREFIPPISTHYTQMGSKSFLNPGFDMNCAFTGFQDNNEVMSDLPQNVGAWMHSTDDQKLMFNDRPVAGLGPSYDFQRPAAGDQIHCLRPVNMDLGLGGGKDIDMEIADVNKRNGFERCTALSSLPLVGSQIMQFDIGQNNDSEQIVFSSSTGMISNQSSSRQLPEYNVNSDGKFSSQSSTTPLLGVATGSTRGQDPSSNHGQSQVVCSIQQSNPPLGPGFPSDLGRQTEMGNMTAQVSGPSMRSSLKRCASELQPSAIQAQRRRTLTTHPLVPPSVPTWTRPALPVPNTAQTIPPLIHRATSLTPHAPHSIVRPSIPTWTKSALSAPNISQRIPPLIRPNPSLPSLACANVPHPLHNKRMSSFHPSSQIITLPHQPQTAQSLPIPRWRPPILSSAPKISPVHIKYKGADQTPELIGHKCLICKRDLSFTPEGPIFQPTPPPATAVLPCGHTFHSHCLEIITPEDQSKNPPCIPCALGG